MRRFIYWYRCVLAMLAVSVGVSHGAPQAFEVGESLVGELPGGKEADGIIGDFVLRNNMVEAVISCDAPLRRANMSTFYGEDGITPGCLYDLSLQGEDNDQLVVYAPLEQRGAVSWVRVLQDGSDGEAIVETVVTAALGNGISRRHEYRLKDGWQGVVIVSEIANESDSPKEVLLRDGWARLDQSGGARGIRWGDANDPADKCGYAYGRIEHEGVSRSEESKATLEPGAKLVLARFLAVGRSPAEAYGEVAARRGEVTPVTMKLTGPGGEGVASGRAVVQWGDDLSVVAYPDEVGEMSFALPKGKYEVSFEDLGRESQKVEVQVGAAEAAPYVASFGAASGIGLMSETERERAFRARRSLSVLTEPRLRIWVRPTGRMGAGISIIPRRGHFA